MAQNIVFYGLVCTCERRKLLWLPWSGVTAESLGLQCPEPVLRYRESSAVSAVGPDCVLSIASWNIKEKLDCLVDIM